MTQKHRAPKSVRKYWAAKKREYRAKLKAKQLANGEAPSKAASPTASAKTPVEESSA